MSSIQTNHAQRGFTLLELMVVIAILAIMAGMVVPMIGDSTDNVNQIARDATMVALRDGFVGNAAGPGLYADVRYVPGFDIRNLRIGHLLAQSASGSNFNAYDSVTRKGWRGPYVRSGQPVLIANIVSGNKVLQENSFNTFPASTQVPGHEHFSPISYAARNFFSAPYGIVGDAAVGDEWGNPYVLQIITLPALPTPLTSEQSERAWKFARIVSAGSNGIIDTPFTDDLTGRLAGRLGINNISERGDDIVIFLNRSDIYELAP